MGGLWRRRRMPVEFEQGCVKLARYTRCMHGRHDSHLSARGVTLSSQAFLVRRHFRIGTYRGPPPPELNPIVQTLTGMQRVSEFLERMTRKNTLPRAQTQASTARTTRARSAVSPMAQVGHAHSFVANAFSRFDDLKKVSFIC